MTDTRLLLICSFFVCFCHSVWSDSRPNIVFVLTDDQDIALGGATPMVKTKRLIGDQGMTFDNMYVSVPVCCPSRSSILTGKYQHNHHAVNNSIEGNCSSTDFQNTQETEAFPVYLNSSGYSTFFAGKYLNRYGFAKVGGVRHVPPGWDWWMGLVGNSVYYNYTLSINGTAEKHGDNYQTDYLTDLINRRATEFLNLQSTDTGPFFMMLSTPACHAPYTAAPQHSQKYSNDKAPRDGSFNMHANDKHWLLREKKTPIPNGTLPVLDDVFRNRWRTLLSVDDMVENVVNLLQQKGLLDNTYIFFSSDNGYHIGQFRIPHDKRLSYEFDVRVPFMVRGPGIKAGTKSQDLVMNIDLAPTFISLSGQQIPPQMDGTSLLPILHNTEDRQQRSSILIEYHGEYFENIRGCPQYKHQFMAWCQYDCMCEDSKNNTYNCLLKKDGENFHKYCKFEDDEDFEEMYDLISDPDELNNAISTADNNVLNEMKTLLQTMTQCSGRNCNQVVNPTTHNTGNPRNASTLPTSSIFSYFMSASLMFIYFMKTFCIFH